MIFISISQKHQNVNNIKHQTGPSDGKFGSKIAENIIDSNALPVKSPKDSQIKEQKEEKEETKSVSKDLSNSIHDPQKQVNHPINSFYPYR